jgi:hypothetical protein
MDGGGEVIEGTGEDRAPGAAEQSSAVAALLADLRNGIRALEELPLEGVPPALGDPAWP